MATKPNFLHVGSFDVSSIKNAMYLFTSGAWDEFDYRQKTFEPHRKTKTIPLIFDSDFRLSNPTYMKNGKLFEKDLVKIASILNEHYGDGFIIRAILVKLVAGAEIPRHIDRTDSLSVCKRCHIPVSTNPNVFFQVDEEVRNMEEGQIWEINNAQKYHSVSNNSDQDRVHLIVDWMLNAA